MIEVKVITPEGLLLSERVEIVMVSNEDGEQGIMKDHIPLVVTINPGYIRLRRNDEMLYVTILGGYLEFSHNVATIIAQEAEVGMDYENALKHLHDYRKQRQEENRQKTIDFTKAERDLREHIKNINASKFKKL